MMLLEEQKFLGTILPRIPVPIAKEIEKSLVEFRLSSHKERYILLFSLLISQAPESPLLQRDLPRGDVPAEAPKEVDMAPTHIVMIIMREITAVEMVVDAAVAAVRPDHGMEAKPTATVGTDLTWQVNCKYSSSALVSQRQVFCSI